MIQSIPPERLLILSSVVVLTFTVPAMGDTIESNALEVTVSPDFPRVEQYLYKTNNFTIDEKK